MEGPDLRHTFWNKINQFSEKLFCVTGEKCKGLYVDFQFRRLEKK